MPMSDCLNLHSSGGGGGGGDGDGDGGGGGGGGGDDAMLLTYAQKLQVKPA